MRFFFSSKFEIANRFSVCLQLQNGNKNNKYEKFTGQNQIKLIISINSKSYKFQWIDELENKKNERANVSLFELKNLSI